MANLLAQKKGPLPVWGWVVAGLVAYWVYRRFASGSSGAASASPVSIGTGTNSVPLDTGGGTAASGGGSAADNLTGDLLSQLAGNLTSINSNLVTGLLGATSSVEGLGYGAYGLAAQSQQALLDFTTRTYSSPTGGVTTQGGGGGVTNVYNTYTQTRGGSSGGNASPAGGAALYQPLGGGAGAGVSGGFTIPKSVSGTFFLGSQPQLGPYSPVQTAIRSVGNATGPLAA